MRLVPIAQDGWKFIWFFLLLGLFLVIGRTVAALAVGSFCLLMTAFLLHFFRDPEREIPAGEGLILSPADGRVLEIATIDGEGFGPGRVIRIFLAPWDVHINRAPADARVTEVRYRPGAFLDARDPRAPMVNESNAIHLESPDGRLMMRQISGFLARRILCWVEPGQTVKAGERVGLIRLGSQTDLYLPSEAMLDVKVGDKVAAGTSVIGRWPRAGAKGAPADPAPSRAGAT